MVANTQYYTHIDHAKIKLIRSELKINSKRKGRQNVEFLLHKGSFSISFRGRNPIIGKDFVSYE